METVEKKRQTNILLLSCGTGEGHNRAAQAIGNALERRGISHKYINPIALCNRRAGKRVDIAYNRMIQNRPKRFNFLYRVGALYDRTGWISPVYSAIAPCGGPLSSYIRDNHFSAVICTHLFAMEAMTAARKKYACSIPCFGLLTDYTCIPFTAETRMDGYFIPHPDLISELMEKGIPREKMIPTGIPVSKKFANHPSKAAARSALDLPKDRPLFLVMGGGAGSGNMLLLCQKLLEYSDRYAICIMTGQNSNLYQSLKTRFSKEKSVFVIPYTRLVDLYMSAADVIITKPGGLSSTEAAVANIPLVHLLNYKACEERNAEFFSARGMSVWAKSADDAVSAAHTLLLDREKVESMCAAQRKNMNPDAAEAITDCVVNPQ